MYKQAQMGSPIYSFTPVEVEGFDSLAKLALDMRWSWSHYGDKVWRQLDPELWELTQNPWVAGRWLVLRSGPAAEARRWAAWWISSSKTIGLGGKCDRISSSSSPSSASRSRASCIDRTVGKRRPIHSKERPLPVAWMRRMSRIQRLTCGVPAPGIHWMPSNSGSDSKRSR